MSNDRQPWERLSEETDRAWSAFQTYRNLLPGERSYDAAYRKSYNKPTKFHAPAWYRAWAKQHNWRERAGDWDRHLDDIERAAMEEERIAWRKKRRKMLQGFGSKLAESLNTFDPGEAGVSLNQLTQAVQMLIQEMRAEMDDLPTERRDVDIKSGGQPIKVTTIEVVKDYGDQSISDN